MKIAGHDFWCDEEGGLHWGDVHTILVGRTDLPGLWRVRTCIGMEYTPAALPCAHAHGTNNEESFWNLVAELQRQVDAYQRQLHFEATGEGPDCIRLMGQHFVIDTRGFNDKHGTVDKHGVLLIHPYTHLRASRQALLDYAAKTAQGFQAQIDRMHSALPYQAPLQFAHCERPTGTKYDFPTGYSTLPLPQGTPQP